jgi:hypothetical protein
MHHHQNRGTYPQGFGPITNRCTAAADLPLVLFAEHNPFPSATAWPTVAELTAAGEVRAQQGLPWRLPPPVPAADVAAVSAPEPVVAGVVAPVRRPPRERIVCGPTDSATAEYKLAKPLKYVLSK